MNKPRMRKSSRYEKLCRACGEAGLHIALDVIDGPSGALRLRVPDPDAPPGKDDILAKSGSFMVAFIGRAAREVHEELVRIGRAPSS